MTIHHFDSTGQAYDACQCEAEINDGDVLVIESEGVVGLAHCWPVAITKLFGELHTAKSGRWDDLRGMFTEEQLRKAETVALDMGLAVMGGPGTRKSDLHARLNRLSKAERRDPKDWAERRNPKDWRRSGYLQRWERYREARLAIEAQLSKLP